jgi:hypothetical protein
MIGGHHPPVTYDEAGIIHAAIMTWRASSIGVTLAGEPPQRLGVQRPHAAPPGRLGREVIEDMHSTDVESPPPPPCV